MVTVHNENAGTTAPSPTKGIAQARSEPILSIIIPTYNNAQFLPQAIDSVISQNVAGCEIVVVDDGSTDETGTVLAPYAGKIHLVHQENAGSAAARNAGLVLAKGEFVVFLDADDWLLPGKLAAQMQILVERPSLGLVHSGWRVVGGDGNVLREVEPWHDAPVLDLDAWVWQKPVQMGAMMFRRVWLDHVGGFDPKLRQSQDVDLLLRLALAGCAAAWLPQITFCYRIYAASTIRQQSPQQHHYLMCVLDKFFADARVPAHLQAAEASVRYYTLRWIAWHFYETGYEAEMTTPLRDAWALSPFSPLETVLDWVAFWRQSLVAAERPLAALSDVLPFFQGAAALGDSWPQLVRLLAWWQPQDDALDEEGQRSIVQLWPLWETAVADEAAVDIPAEQLLDWYCAVGRPLSQGNVRQAVAGAGEFAGYTPAKLETLCKWLIVQQSDAMDGRRVAAFWQGLAWIDLIMRANLNRVAGLLLTLFGQQVLHRRYAAATQTLLQVLGYTAVHPTSVGQWMGFVKTAVSYFRRN